MNLGSVQHSHLANHHMNPSSTGYWFAVQSIQDILRLAIDPHLTDQSKIAISGSSALFWYQDRTGKGRSWPFVPNDIDIFVCGVDEPTDFLKLVAKARQGINRSSNRAVVAEENTEQNTYAQPGTNLLIANLYIANIHRVHPDRRYKVSFVQSAYPTVQQTVQNFDIDVCRVIYHIHHDSFELPDENTATHIEYGKAALTRNLVLFERVGRPNHHEIKKACDTLRRMQKYSKRGYEFVDAAGLLFVGNGFAAAA